MKKIFRIVGLIAVVIVIAAAIIASLNQKVPNSERIWDEATTVGDINAENYFVVYSDLVCPYCVAFENAIIEHEAEFENYIQEKNILFEVRVSDFLYEYGETRPISSLYGAEATFCAKNQGRFWDYYRAAITDVWNNYLKTSGKSGITKLNKLGKDYWITIGTNIGLDENFVNCVKNGETDAEITENAAKTSKITNGLPYTKFNKYIGGGFSLSGTWEDVLTDFEIGLKKR